MLTLTVPAYRFTPANGTRSHGVMELALFFFLVTVIFIQIWGQLIVDVIIYLYIRIISSVIDHCIKSGGQQWQILLLIGANDFVS